MKLYFLSAFSCHLLFHGRCTVYLIIDGDCIFTRLGMSSRRRITALYLCAMWSFLAWLIEILQLVNCLLNQKDLGTPPPPPSLTGDQSICSNGCWSGRIPGWCRRPIIIGLGPSQNTKGCSFICSVALCTLLQLCWASICWRVRAAFRGPASWPVIMYLWTNYHIVTRTTAMMANVRM